MDERVCLSGKTAVITGATAGIGLATATALARQGTWVIGVGRNAQRSKAAGDAIRVACPGARVNMLLADLSVQSEVRRLAEDVRKLLAENGVTCLDMLVNDAGTYTDHYVRTVDGAERTLAVNHFAPFLLTLELLPLLKASPDARVVTVSSESHFRTWINLKRLNHPFVYNGLWAYKVSKLANVLFTMEINRRLTGTNVRAFAVDPGLVKTDIGLKGTHGISNLVWKLRQRSGVPPEKPAETIAYLCSEPTLRHTSQAYWRDLLPLPPSRQAQNEATARSLWEFSCQFCDIKG
jgi:NAD(P)-dependent dehydrogenase (short-subunit alcohol dehydrogenase family)